MTPPRPWSTMPITGAQHAAWMAEERESTAPELISRRDADLIAGLFHPDTDPNQLVREYIAAYDAAHRQEVER